MKLAGQTILQPSMTVYSLETTSRTGKESTWEPRWGMIHGFLICSYDMGQKNSCFVLKKNHQFTAATGGTDSTVIWGIQCFEWVPFISPHQMCFAAVIKLLISFKQIASPSVMNEPTLTTCRLVFLFFLDHSQANGHRIQQTAYRCAHFLFELHQYAKISNYMKAMGNLPWN